MIEVVYPSSHNHGSGKLSEMKGTNIEGTHFIHFPLHGRKLNEICQDSQFS